MALLAEYYSIPNREGGDAIMMKDGYQLWCYYETEDTWKMEGFFRTKEGAREELVRLRQDVDTPAMPNWKYTEVRYED